MSRRLRQLPPRADEALIRRDFASLKHAPRFETVLVTGGTGVIGRWLITHLDAVNRTFNQLSTVYLVTRTPSEALDFFRNLSHVNVQLIAVENLQSFVSQIKPSNIWHLSASTGSDFTTSMLDPIEADLHLATKICRGVELGGFAPHVLYTSSGAVYGRPSAPMTARPPQAGINDDFSDANLFYGYGKILSESLFIALSRNLGAQVSIARLFSFSGPLIPLDRHYAIGNFVLDALLKRPIRVNSTGRSIRSWMDLGDLARYLLLLANLPNTKIVDIGSSEAMSIIDAARTIAEITGLSVELKSDDVSDREDSIYVPNLTMLQDIVRLSTLKDFRDSITCWLSWLTSNERE